MSDEENLTPKQALLEFAEFANDVAALVVGHRKILVEGGFDINMADIMSARLHGEVLGLLDERERQNALFYAYEEEEEEEWDEEDEAE